MKFKISSYQLDTDGYGTIFVDCPGYNNEFYVVFWLGDVETQERELMDYNRGLIEIKEFGTLKKEFGTLKKAKQWCEKYLEEIKKAVTKV